MPVMAQVPADSPLMKAWTAYQETDDFKNSLMWATVTKYSQAGRDVPNDDITNIQREQHAKGSLWAAFTEGFKAGGNEPYLGLATTGELLNELRARIEMHALGGLNYRTVDGELAANGVVVAR